MTILKRFITRAAAIAAAGAIGFAAMGDAALAKGAQNGNAPTADKSGLIQLADRGHRGRDFRRDVFDIRCETAAIRRNGQRLRGTYSTAVRDNQRQACRVALRECNHRLDRERRHDRRAYPFARCKVVDTDRVLAHRGRGRGHGANIILRF